LKILTDFDVFLYWRDDSKVNSFFNLFAKDQNFMNTIQNIRSVFTDLSTDFSTSKIVDNVHNSVYNSIFSHFLQLERLTTIQKLLFHNTFHDFPLAYLLHRLYQKKRLIIHTYLFYCDLT